MVSGYFTCISLTIALNLSQQAENSTINKMTINAIDVLIDKSEKVLSTRADSSYLYANEAVTLSKQMHDTLHLLKSLKVKSKAQTALFQYNDAIEICNQASLLALKINNYKLLWEFKNDIGKIYFQKNDFANALNYYIEALRIAEESDTKENRAKSNKNIAFVLKSQQKYSEAIIYLENALKIWKELNDSLNITKTHINIAGNLALLGNYNQSLEFLFEAKKFAAQISDTALLSDIMVSIANNYSFKSDIQRAESYYLDALRLKKKMNDKKGLATICNNISVFYINNSNYLKGEFYAFQAQKQAEESGLLAIQMSSCKGLSFIYSEQKKYDLAYQFQNKYIRLKDSLFSIEKAEQIEEIKTKFETEKKAQQILILETENQLKATEISHRKTETKFLTGGVVLFIVMFLIIYIAYKGKKKSNLVLSEKNSLIEQQKIDLNLRNIELNKANSTKDRLFSIIAHDLRSPMSSMEGLSVIIRQLLVDGKVEKLDAVASHIDQSIGRINALLDNLLNWSLSQIKGITVNPVQINLRKMALYSVEIQKSLLNTKAISTAVYIDDNITVFADQNMLRTIFRNLIGNAIKFTPKDGAIVISASAVNNIVNVSIKDTGIGISGDKIETIFDINEKKITPGTDGIRGTGIGLSLCRDFVELNMGHIEISSQVGIGTEVKFTLPFYNIQTNT